MLIAICVLNFNLAREKSLNFIQKRIFSKTPTLDMEHRAIRIRDGVSQVKRRRQIKIGKHHHRLMDQQAMQIIRANSTIQRNRIHLAHRIIRSQINRMSSTIS